MSPPKVEARRWFYVREGRRQGPVDTEKLVDLVLAGEVDEEALVWHAGLPEWLKAREVDEIRRELPPPVPPAPPPPLSATPLDEGATGDAPDGGPHPAPEAPADGAGDGLRRRRKRKHRHREAKKRPAWLYPLVAVLVVLMLFLWWLLRRMNEVPPGRIIQTGEMRQPGSTSLPSALGWGVDGAYFGRWAC
jgi:hypothetical protein